MVSKCGKWSEDVMVRVCEGNHPEAWEYTGFGTADQVIKTIRKCIRLAVKRALTRRPPNARGGKGRR